MTDAAAPDLAAPKPKPALARVDAALRAQFLRREGGTYLHRLYQQGSARMRFPRTHAEKLEAVTINTAGGLTGGDRWTCALDLDARTGLTLTTPACERIYRSIGGTASVATTITLGAGSTLDWLPQETILFDGAALDRRLDIAMAEDAYLLAVEPIIFGRAAMGETVRRVALSDRWRVRRGNRLIYADRLAIDGDAGPVTAAKAGLDRATAIATLLLVSPDAAERLDALRTAFCDLPARCGASAWDGMLAVRIAASDGALLRRSLVAMLACLRPGSTLPRLWSC